MKLCEIQDRSRVLLRIVAIGALLLSTDACVEPYLPAVIEEEQKILVVDGFLIGNDSTFIRLSRTAPLYSTASTLVEGNASVWIEAESGTTYQLMEMGNGIYVAPPLNLTISDDYRLHIRTIDQHEYVSEYVGLKASPPFDSITWKEELTHDNIEFSIYTHDQQNNTRYYLWNYEETWMYVSGGISVYYYENGDILPRSNATELYNCWKTQASNTFSLASTAALSEDRVYDFLLYSIPQVSRKLYFQYSVLVRQYAITREAYEYFAIIKKNTESMGSLFDDQPAEPTSNIRCTTNPSEPVVGFFGASTLQTKRISFKRQDIIGPSSPYEPTGYENCGCVLIPLDQISDSNFEGRLINNRYYDPFTFELVGYMVCPEDCLDCRMKGGTTVKPDFWN